MKNVKIELLQNSYISGLTTKELCAVFNNNTIPLDDSFEGTESSFLYDLEYT